MKSMLGLFLLLALGPWSRASDVQTFFADESTPEPALLKEINAAEKSIHLCLYSFTDRSLARALVNASRRGVEVRLILDRSQTAERNSEAGYLTENLGADRVQLHDGRTGPGSIMHHKFAVFDRQQVATGSYNWTSAARNYNFENLVVIVGPSGLEAASLYEQEFNRIWSNQ